MSTMRRENHGTKYLKRQNPSIKLRGRVAGTRARKSLRFFPGSGCGREMDVETQEEKQASGGRKGVRFSSFTQLS